MFWRVHFIYNQFPPREKILEGLVRLEFRAEVWDTPWVGNGGGLLDLRATAFLDDSEVGAGGPTSDHIGVPDMSGSKAPIQRSIEGDSKNNFRGKRGEGGCPAPRKALL